MPSMYSDIPDRNSPFITDSQINDMLFGIGSGMATSESGFVRGFGTAMAGVAGQKIRERERMQTREERLADLAMIEESKIRAEGRAEEAQIRQEGRAESAQVRQEGRAEEAQIRQEGRALDLADEQRRRDKAYFAGQRFSGISRGLKPPSKPSATDDSFFKWLSRTLGSAKLQFAGKPPIDPYRDIVQNRIKNFSPEPIDPYAFFSE